MNLASDDLLRLGWTQSWQVAVLTIAVAVVVQVAGRRRPHLTHLLWMLVIVKALTPPVWGSPIGAFSWATATWASPQLVAAAPSPADPPRLEFDLDPSTTTIDPRPIPQPRRAELPQSPPVSTIDAGDLLLLAWLGSSIVLLSITLVRRAALGRLVRRSATAIDAATWRQFEALRRRIGPRRPVRLVLTSAPLGPAAYGWWRGTVIVPDSLVQGKSPGETAAIFTHELVHLRRFDTLFGSLQLAAQIVWWFHPAVWWANRQARSERERACDEEVVAELDCRPADYARLLLQVLQWRHHLTSTLLWPGMRSGDVTARRLQHVLHHARSFRRRTPAWCWLAFAGAVAIALPGGSLQLAAAPDRSTVPVTTAQRKAATVPDENISTLIEEATIARLRQLGVQIESHGSGPWPEGQPFRTHLTATLPSSFRPTGLPLLLATLDRLQTVIVGARPPSPQPTEHELREQLLALKQLPPAAELIVQYTTDNAGALDAIEEIAGLECLMLQSYSTDAVAGFGAELATVPLGDKVPLDRLTNLRSLRWWGFLDDANLAKIAALTKLESLSLLGSMTEPGLNRLAALTSLKSLSLSHQVFDQPTVTLDLACLEGLPNLEGLHVSGFLLGDAAGDRIGQLTKLRQVTAGDISSLTDAGLWQLTEARNLQSVMFFAGQGAENLSPAGLAALGRLTYLETLRFYGQTLPGRTPLRVTDESLVGWKTLGNLRTLCVGSCRVGDRGLRAVGQLASLEKVQLVGQLNITDEGLAPLAALANLQALVLHESAIDGSGLAVLAGLENLRLLSLKDTPINDQGLEEIAKFNTLRALDISGTAVTDAGLAQLRNKLPELTRLNLAGTKITDRGFAAIAGHKNLRELNASDTALTVAFLARLLEANPELKVWTIDSGDPQSKERFSGVFEPIDVDTLNYGSSD